MSDGPDLSIYDTNDSHVPAKRELRLFAGILWRWQHDPVFLQHHELGAGESGTMLYEETMRVGSVLPFRQQVFRSHFVHSEDAARREARKRLHVPFANHTIQKSSPAEIEDFRRSSRHSPFQQLS